MHVVCYCIPRLATSDGIDGARKDKLQGRRLISEVTIRPVMDLNASDDGIVSCAAVHSLRDQILQVSCDGALCHL